MSASSKKTLYLDWLQLKSLSFKSLSNTNFPSSFVLTSKGDGTTYFTSLSSISQVGFTDIYVPGQNILNSNTTLNLSSFGSDIVYSTNSVSSLLYIGTNIGVSLASTMNNILSYPSFTSSFKYDGGLGETLITSLTPNSADAKFTSLRFDANNFKNYINPNGSTRVFLDYYPTFIFSPVVGPSSISSVTLYPEGSSNLKSFINISSHTYFTKTGVNLAIPESGIQQYMNITSFYGYGVSSQSRYTSNIFNQPIRMQLNSALLYSNPITTYEVVHYVSSSLAFKTVDDVSRTGLEDSRTQILTSANNNVFITLNNSANSV